MTARSVITRFTTLLPVSGNVQASSSFWFTVLGLCAPSTRARGSRPRTRSIAPPMPFTRFPGIIQLARSPRWGHFHCTKNGQVDVAAANHRERIGTGEKGRARSERHGLLAGIDQVCINFSLERKGSHAQQAVFRLQHDRNIGRNIVLQPVSAYLCRG